MCCRHNTNSGLVLAYLVLLILFGAVFITTEDHFKQNESTVPLFKHLRLKNTSQTCTPSQIIANLLPESTPFFTNFTSDSTCAPANIIKDFFSHTNLMKWLTGDSTYPRNCSTEFFPWAIYSRVSDLCFQDFLAMLVLSFLALSALTSLLLFIQMMFRCFRVSYACVTFIDLIVITKSALFGATVCTYFFKTWLEQRDEFTYETSFTVLALMVHMLLDFCPLVCYILGLQCCSDVGYYGIPMEILKNETTSDNTDWKYQTMKV